MLEGTNKKESSENVCVGGGFVRQHQTVLNIVCSLESYTCDLSKNCLIDSSVGEHWLSHLSGFWLKQLPNSMSLVLAFLVVVATWLSQNLE